MNILLVIASLLFLTAKPTQAAVQVNADLPFPITLKCESVQFVKGLPDFKDPTQYFPAYLSQNSHDTAELTLGNSNDKKPGAVRSGHGIVRFDFSDGDQTSFFDLSQKDLEALNEGTKSVIEGFYQDGFDWTHGYNVRAMFRVKCSRN